MQVFGKDRRLGSPCGRTFIGGVLLLVLTLGHWTVARAERVPASVLFYESLRVKGRVPVMQLPDGSTLAVDRLCPLLSKAATLGPRFITQPEDFMGEPTCDTSKVLLAWSGWCDRGVRDAKTGVHFSQSHWPVAVIDHYDEGWRVVRLQNIAQAAERPTEADEAAALAFFKALADEGLVGLLQPVFDVRSPRTALFPADWHGVFPPQRGLPWH